jgi:hypothetical protein
VSLRSTLEGSPETDMPVRDARAKERKTAIELAAMVMNELRDRAEYSRILHVAIVRRFEPRLHNPNWDATFTVAGGLIPPESAVRVARELQSRFDLD